MEKESRNAFVPNKLKEPCKPSPKAVYNHSSNNSVTSFANQTLQKCHALDMQTITRETVSIPGTMKSSVPVIH